MSVEVDAVRKFFEEHPVHSFSIPAIAKYLKLSEKKVEQAVEYLWFEDIIEKRYRFIWSACSPKKVSKEWHL